MLKRIALLATLLTSSAFSSEGNFLGECRVDHTIMYAIASNERHPKREIGYQYLISLNNKTDQVEAKKLVENGWLDSRTIDCKNAERCVEVMQTLVDAKITNLDLGAYQFNYTYFKFPMADYFSVESSYDKACKRIVELEKKYGWSWATIARYHSATKHLNAAYSGKLIRTMQTYQ